MGTIQKWNLAIVGATGQVGKELLSVLSVSGFPSNSIRLFASRDSEGERTEDDERIEAFKKGAFAGIDLVFLAAPSTAAESFLKEAREQGCYVVDFNRFSGPNWLVPDVNGDDEDAWEGKWLGSPCPEVIGLSHVLDVLRDCEVPTRVEAQVFLSASDMGRKGVEELASQTINLLNQKEVPEDVFGERLAFALLPLAGDEDDRLKLAGEQLKAVLNEPELAVALEQVRVPVFTGTTLRARVEFENPVAVQAVAETFAKNDVCDLWDTDGELSVPRVSDIPEVSEVRVGGVQQLDARTITLWITLDNLRRGAALNGLQIAAELVKRHAD